MTIAGSDSGGGAGIQADIKTMSALGVYGLSAITALTAQNTCGVSGILPATPDFVRQQIDAVLSDIGADAIKIGMLYDRAIAEAVCECLDRFGAENIVLDPVMISTSGHKLIEDDAICYIRQELFCRAALVTPNVDEAALLSGVRIDCEKDLYTAADRLLKSGCRAVLMKGGHLEGGIKTDILFSDGATPLVLRADEIDTRNAHGTGCTLSSAIASYLALGKELIEAVILSKRYITEALRAGSEVQTGRGHGPLNHFFDPRPLRKRIDNEKVEKIEFNKSDAYMKVFFNNHELFVGPRVTLRDLLAGQSISTEGMAVAVNNVVIPKEEWRETLLSNGDKVIVVKAAYGG